MTRSRSPRMASQTSKPPSKPVQARAGSTDAFLWYGDANRSSRCSENSLSTAVYCIIVFPHTFCQGFLIQIFNFEISLRLTSLILLCDILPFIIQFFTACQTDLDFYEAAFKIHLQRNERVAFFLDLRLKFADLIVVQQQFPDAQRVFIEYVALLVRTCLL